MKPVISTASTLNRFRFKTSHGPAGMALIEALVAAAVLGIGLAGATRLTLHTLMTASDTRQLAVAHVLALDAMDCLQSGRASCHLQANVSVQGTRYTLQSQIQARPGLALVDLQVHVQWPAMGRAPGSQEAAEVSGGGTFRHAQSQRGELVLHSSRDAVPTWLGVSLP